MFLKKLHIKILSVAFLVTLVSYNASESRLLPQQFAYEYVEYTDTSQVVAIYSRLYDDQVISVSEYIVFDFQNYVFEFNISQNVDYKKANLKRTLIKKDQQKVCFLNELIRASKDVHTSFI